MLHVHDHTAILLNWLISGGILLFRILPVVGTEKEDSEHISKVSKH